MSKHTVLGMSRWKMTDKETGEVRSGVKVAYLPEVGEADESRKGFLPLEIGGPIELWNKLSQFPSQCELEFTQKMQSVNGSRKVVALLASIEPLKDAAKV